MQFLLLSLVLAVVFSLLSLLNQPVRRRRRFLRLLREQLAAHRSGDYEAQLKIIEGFRVNGSEPANYLFFKGSALRELGRLEEAKEALRCSLALETNPALRVLCRSQIGRALMEQERWEDAAACFRDCVAQSPKRGGGQRALAELLLRRGREPHAALDAARVAVALDRAQEVHRRWLSQELHDYNLAESLAVFAWALAANHGAPADVQSSLAEAFALCGETNHPTLAGLHFFAAHACALLGDPAAATRHFQAAVETDPHGNYGRLSQAVV